MILRLHPARWRCRNAVCERRIFTEPLPRIKGVGSKSVEYAAHPAPQDIQFVIRDPIERVSRTRIPTTSFLTSCSALPFVRKLGCGTSRPAVAQPMVNTKTCGFMRPPDRGRPPVILPL